MSLSTLAAEIAKRVPDMARDSAVNNEALLFRLMTDEFARSKKWSDVLEENLKPKPNQTTGT